MDAVSLLKVRLVICTGKGPGSRFQTWLFELFVGAVRLSRPCLCAGKDHTQLQLNQSIQRCLWCESRYRKLKKFEELRTNRSPELDTSSFRMPRFPFEYSRQLCALEATEKLSWAQVTSQTAF